MKLEIFLIIVICIGIVFPSSYVPHNAKKINREGEYQPYFGYTIIAKVDTELSKVTKQIEQFIQTSNLKKSYAPLPADTYHVSIYTIYSIGNKLIPPVERWLNDVAGRKIPKQGWLPDEALMQENKKAMHVLEKNVGEPLYIKDATLTKGKTTLSLTVEVEEESLRRIENARKELVQVYEHPNLSLEPINEKLHITLAYAYGKKSTIDEDVWDQLNELVEPLKEAKLMPPSVYLFESMKKYHQFKNEPWNNLSYRSADGSLHCNGYQLCLFILLFKLLSFIAIY